MITPKFSDIESWQAFARFFVLIALNFWVFFLAEYCIKILTISQVNSASHELRGKRYELLFSSVLQVYPVSIFKCYEGRRASSFVARVPNLSMTPNLHLRPLYKGKELAGGI